MKILKQYKNKKDIKDKSQFSIMVLILIYSIMNFIEINEIVFIDNYQDLINLEILNSLLNQLVSWTII